MAQTSRIIETLKVQLKKQGITYRELAHTLGLSESAVKQMFSSGDMNLSRLDKICDILSMDISDLVSVMEASSERLTSLTLAQEQQLITNPKLLVIAYCVINHWTIEQIISTYEIEEPEAIKLLVQLDRMSLIELLPGNRAKVLVASNFDWLPNGPIETFFRKEAQGPFFDSSFDGDGCVRLVKSGDISASSRQNMCDRLAAIGQHFDDLVIAESKLSFEQRNGTTVVLAIRNWEFEAFKSLKREG